MIMLVAWIFPHLSPVGVAPSLLLNLVFLGIMRAVFRLKWNERNIYITLTQFITFWALQATFNPAVGTIIETLYHDIQYIFFMLAFQTYRRLPLRNFILLFIVGAILGFLAESPAVEPLFRRGIYAVVLGVLVYHYLIDGLIWRFSKAPELSELKSVRVFGKT